MSEQSARVRSVLFCDDVRLESSGKIIVIGVYSSEIGIRTIPGKIRFRTVVIIDIPAAGEFKLRFKLIDHTDNSEMEAEIEITTVESGNNILMPGFDFGLDVNQPGNIEVLYHDDGWNSVGTWNIRPAEYQGPSAEQTVKN